MPPLFFLLLLLPFLHSATPAGAGDICVVGSGISDASTAFFLANYTWSSSGPALQLRIFERCGRVGGRLATVTVAGDEFEAGGSIIHRRNLHVRRFADLLGVAAKTAGDDDWLGIWDGARFVFNTLYPPPPGSSTASPTPSCCSGAMASRCSGWIASCRKCCKCLCLTQWI